MRRIVLRGSGFVKPAGGTITAFGENLLKMADFRLGV